jgi:geranylgeranyl diphosphate synthase, type III
VNLHRGQGQELYWRDTLTCPTEADYLEMVSQKTGGLFRLAIKLMQAESMRNHSSNGQNPLDCVPLIITIGLLFQILDDHLNLSSYSSQKGLCEDLTEGKFSFPVIHAIRADPHNHVLLNILKQKTQDETVKKYAVDYMERVGSFDYSRKCISELRARALELVAQLEERVEDEGKRRAGGEAIRGILARMKVP